MRRLHFCLRAAPAALFLFSLSSLPLLAQEQLGLRLERYAGIWGAGLNPSQTAFNPNNWEVNLFAADLFFENSYAYLHNTSLPNALRNTDHLISVTDLTRERPLAPDDIVLDFFDAKRRMHGVLQARVAGPGFSFRFNENNVVGLITSVRAGISSYRIPEILAYRTISDLPRNQAIDIPATKLQGMAWSEIGLHYSRRQTDGDLHTAWGLTPKFLLGAEGFYTEAESSFDYTQRQGDTVAFGRARWEYGLTTGNLNDPNTTPAGYHTQGRGFGLDLGFSWAQPDAADEDNYAWRLGVSLLDLGFLRYKRPAEQHRIVFDTVVTVSNTNFPPRSDPKLVLQDASQAFLGNATQSLQARAFSIGLPTALSVQFDMQIAPLMYVGAALIQRIPLQRHSLQRPGTLAVTPRFEHRWVSVSFPIVLDDWRSLRMGLAGRFGFLAFGTDNLNSFFQKEKLTGGDVYIGLKINGFSIHFKEKEGAYKGRGNARTSKQKLRKIKCYQF